MEKNINLHLIQPFAKKVLRVIFENIHFIQVQTLLLDNIAKTVPIKALEKLTKSFKKALLDKISLNLQNNADFKQKIQTQFRLRRLLDHYRVLDQSVFYLLDDIAEKLKEKLKLDKEVVINKYLNPWRANKLPDSKKIELEKILVECLEPILEGLPKSIQHSAENQSNKLLNFDLTISAEKYQISLLIETAQTLISQHTEALIAVIPQLKDYFAAVQLQLGFEISSEASTSSKNSFKSLPDVIDQAANDYKGKVAIEEWDASAELNISYTYQELKNCSDALAIWLLSQNFPAGAIVWLFLEPSFDYVCCQIGVLKAHLAFVPLDPYKDVGFERLKSITATCEPVAILTHAALQSHEFAKHCKASELANKTHDLAALLNYKNNLPLHSSKQPKQANELLSTSLNHLNNTEQPQEKGELKSEQRAYVIFTSGSTGNPKGIEISHAGIMPMVEGLAKAMDIKSKDYIAQYAQLGFDMSLAEIWVPLCYGASLKIIPLAERLQYTRLPYHFKNVTVAMLTPTVLKHFEPKLEQNMFKKLRYVISAGEKGDLELFKNCANKRKGLIIRNGYGPAECTVATTMCELEEKYSDIIHVGKPLDGYTLYLLSLDKKEQPYVEIKADHLKQFCEAQLGTLYELAIGGIGVGIGYFKNEELTQKRFLTLEHPLTGEPIKIFRTYDAVKLIPISSETLLIVEKRLDRAIKPYGKIVYPEDIEAVIKKADEDNIQEVRVEAKLTQNGHPEIAAYIKLKNQAQPINYVELFEYVKQHLSLTHAPRGWTVIEDFEVNSSGKTKEGSQPLEYIRGLDHHYPIVDRNIEQLKTNLQELWREVLELNLTFSLDDNFFYLGGTSMRCEELITRVEKKFQDSKDFKVKITAAEIYCNPTFGNMLRLIRRQQKQIEIPLILLHHEEKPNGEPLFFIHTLTGDVELDYTRVDSNRMGSDSRTFISQLIHDMKDEDKDIARDIYGISAISLSPTHHPIDMPTTIEEITMLYRVAIQKQQSKGPYFLVGWSAGGYIAYEIARQLRTEKKEVTVFMLDTAHPCYRQVMDLGKFSKHLKQTANSFFLRLLGISNKANEENKEDGEKWNLTVNPKSNKHQQIDELFAKLYQLVGNDFIKQRKLATWSIIFHALLDYEIKEVLPFVHLYIAEKTIQDRELPNLGWQQNFYQTIIIKGADHRSIIDNEEHRKKITQVLAKHVVHIRSHWYIKSIINDLRAKYRKEKQGLKKVMMPITLESIKVSESIHKIRLNSDKLLNLYQLHKHNDQHDKLKNILIIGDKGSGKTYLKRTLLYQWAAQSDDSPFVLVIPISLRKFTDTVLKRNTYINMLEDVLRTVLSKLVKSRDKISAAQNFITHLNLLAPHVLIILDDHAKILHENYNHIKHLINKLITKSYFNILLLTDTYKTLPKAVNKKLSNLHLSITDWDQAKIRQFIQTRYSNKKLFYYEGVCNLYPVIQTLCRTPLFLKVLLNSFETLSIKNKDASFNLVRLLRAYEKYQWRKYLKRLEIIAIKEKQDVNVDIDDIDEYGLLALREMCKTEFKFLKKLAVELLIKKQNGLTHSELAASSNDLLSSSDSKVTFNVPFKGALQLGFICQKKHDYNKNIYIFKNEFMRDYFYAIYWVERSMGNVDYDADSAREEAQSEWQSYRWDPKFRQIWSLVAGILASETKHKNANSFNCFCSELVYKNEQYKPIGFYQYLLWMDCYREARDQIIDDDVKQIITSIVITLMRWHLERLSQNMYYDEIEYSFINTLKTNSCLLSVSNIEDFLVNALADNKGRIPSFLWIIELLQIRTHLSSELEELLLKIVKEPDYYPFLSNALHSALKIEQGYSNKIKYLSYLKIDETRMHSIVLKQVFRPLLNLMKMTEQGRQYISQVAELLDEKQEELLTNIKILLPWIFVDSTNVTNNNTNNFVLGAKELTMVKACIEIAKTIRDQKTAESNQTNLVCSYYQALYASNPISQKLNSLNLEDYKTYFNELKIDEIKRLPVDQKDYREFLYNVVKDSYKDICSHIFTPVNKAKTLILEYVVETKRKGVEILLDAILKIYMDDLKQEDKHKQDRLEFYLELLKDNLELASLDTAKLNEFIKDKLLKHKKHSNDDDVLKFAQYRSMLSTVDFKNHFVKLELSTNLTEQDIKILFKSTTCLLKELYGYWIKNQYDIQTLIPLLVSWIMQRNIMLWFSKNGIVIAEPGQTTSHELLELNDTNKGFYDLLQISCDNYLTHHQFSSNLMVDQDKKLVKEEKKIIQQERKLLKEKTNTTLEMIKRRLESSNKQLVKIEALHKKDDEFIAKHKQILEKITAQLSCNLPKPTFNREEDDEGQDHDKTSIMTVTMRKK